MRGISDFFDGDFNKPTLRDNVNSRREGHLLANSIVTIKSWEDLLEIGEVDAIGNIDLVDGYFTSGMRRLCGLSITLDKYAMYDGWAIENSMCEMIDYWAAENEEVDSWGSDKVSGGDLAEGVSDKGIKLSNAIVTIKSWDEMANVGVLDIDGDIFLGFSEGCFIKSMRHLCNQTIVLDEEGYYNDWAISPAMCSKIEYAKPYFAKTADEYDSSPRYDTTELESGMVIKDGYGQVARVSMGTRFGDILLYKNGTWNELSELEQHWDMGDYMEYGLCEVYSPDSVVGVINKSWDLHKDYILIWKREEQEAEERVAMSLEDIEEELGYKIDLI